MQLNVISHHVAGGVLGQTVHHGVHLIKLLHRRLHLRVELFVLGVLVVEHGSVLVSLLIGLYRWVFTVVSEGKSHKILPLSNTKEMSEINKS